MMILLSVFLHFFPSVAGPVCLDKNSKPVDWFIVYKFPVISSSNSSITRAGFGFAYMDANNATFETSPQSLNDSSNPLFYTLQQIYTANGVTGHGYMMYNDENPNGGTSSTYGHSKGTAAWDATDGFWLLHSVPAWPPNGNTSYSFGSVKDPTYAQTFLCTSLDATNLNVVFNQWAWTRPGVYSSFMDEALNASFPGAADVLAGKRVTAAPWTSVANVTTKAGLRFTYFAKYSSWGKELYEDLVAPTLGVHLNTETWQNGVGSINSSCMPDYDWNVQNIAGLAVTSETWVNSKDHAKWAVSDSCTANSTDDLWFCIGDINRQTGQFSRAGGTMCVPHYQIYAAFQKTVLGFKTSCTTGDVCAPPRPPPRPSPSSAGLLAPAAALVAALFLVL